MCHHSCLFQTCVPPLHSHCGMPAVFDASCLIGRVAVARGCGTALDGRGAGPSSSAMSIEC
eukprot:899497-Rhodomonas_salina.1